MTESNSLMIGEVGGRAAVRLRSWDGDPPQALQLPPDLSAEVRVLQWSPNEWLIVSDRLEGPDLRQSLMQEVAGQGIAAVDLTCALKALRVEGVSARELLARGCGIDLHPRSFPPGACTRTRFAQLAVIVDCVDPSPRYELYVGSSYLAWLRSWLEDAAVGVRA